MKLVAMHKVDESIAKGVLPSAKVIEGMGALIGEMMQKGIFLDGDGLKGGSETRARVSVKGGKRTLEKGPYTGRNEVIAGICRLHAPSIDEAIGWCARLAEALGDGVEVEVGPITEEWDLGGPVPAVKPPPRWLALAKADAKAESGTPFLPRIAAVVDEMKRESVFISAEGLAPSKQAKRVNQRRDRRTIIDGPFTESKELVAGFTVMQVATWDEALAWCKRFTDVLGGEIEMDLRPIG